MYNANSAFQEFLQNFTNFIIILLFDVAPHEFPQHETYLLVVGIYFTILVSIISMYKIPFKIAASIRNNYITDDNGTGSLLSWVIKIIVSIIMTRLLILSFPDLVPSIANKILNFSSSTGEEIDAIQSILN